MRIFALLGCLLLLGAGCSSLTGPNQEYTKPAVVGRVLDASTGQPLAGARISRQLGNSKAKDPFPEKGSTSIMAASPEVSDAQGRFSFAAEKTAHLIFTPSRPFMLTLTVEHQDYQTLRTNLDLVVIKATKTPHGPQIDAGDLRLRPKSK